MALSSGFVTADAIQPLALLHGFFSSDSEFEDWHVAAARKADSDYQRKIIEWVRLGELLEAARTPVSPVSPAGPKHDPAAFASQMSELRNAKENDAALMAPAALSLSGEPAASACHPRGVTAGARSRAAQARAAPGTLATASGIRLDPLRWHRRPHRPRGPIFVPDSIFACARLTPSAGRSPSTLTFHPEILAAWIHRHVSLPNNITNYP